MDKTHSKAYIMLMDADPNPIPRIELFNPIERAKRAADFIIRALAPFPAEVALCQSDHYIREHFEDGRD